MACHARAHARKSLMPVWRASSALNSMPLVGKRATFDCCELLRLVGRRGRCFQAWLKKHQTTNLGVMSSNLFWRASKIKDLRKISSRKSAQKIALGRLWADMPQVIAVERAAVRTGWTGRTANRELLAFSCSSRSFLPALSLRGTGSPSRPHGCRPTRPHHRLPGAGAMVAVAGSPPARSCASR
jgi:hypothetical protein